MKRAGRLWPRIVAFDNLHAAARQTRHGKRFTPAALAFEANIEQELLALESELTGKTYRPGDYRSFFIQEPKRRMISAAPYRDRVVHHALINVLGPIFERGFVSESFANRSGYGTHRALQRFTRLARSHRFILQQQPARQPQQQHRVPGGSVGFRQDTSCANCRMGIRREG
jgi:RNA-directed DNA polymerase